MQWDAARKHNTKAIMYWHNGRICGYGYASSGSDYALAAKNEANFLLDYWKRHNGGNDAY
jgi:hypothetical protein